MRVYMCLRVYMCVHVYVRACICVYIDLYIYTYICIHICIYVCVCTCVCACMYNFFRISSFYAVLAACICLLDFTQCARNKKYSKL